jgi:hypothetical protein
MADPNVVNIKTLPRVEEIVNGNLLIVENEQGTNTIDFVNFVVGPNNVSFYTQITNLSSQIVSLSSSTTTLINNLSTTTNQQLTALNARITSLSTTVSNAVSSVFYATSAIFIAYGTTASSLITITKPTSFNLQANDFVLTLATSAQPAPLGGSPNFPSGTSGFDLISAFPLPFIRDQDVANVGNTCQFTIRLTHTPKISAVGVRYLVNRPYGI